MKEESSHWLVRPNTIKRLWWGFSIVLAITLLLQFLIKVKPTFELDGWWGFGAIFGFVSCLVMVLIAKALGFLLKRPEGYYDNEEGQS